MVKLNILLYADDDILFGNTKEDMQLSRTCLHSLYERNNPNINIDKSKIVQFLRPSSLRSSYKFSCEDVALEHTCVYKYLVLNLQKSLECKIRCTDCQLTAGFHELIEGFHWRRFTAVLS